MRSEAEEEEEEEERRTTGAETTQDKQLRTPHVITSIVLYSGHDRIRRRDRGKSELSAALWPVRAGPKRAR